ncbi:MAG: TonB-dependent receptor [Candidatus Fermentibacteraceae bacterium]|nr:TonB-dependent receptor [Candidatus Fermentibacteraceae bacterium]
MKVFIICLLVFSVSAIAGTTGRIAGVVYDTEGSPVIGATVIIAGTEFGTMTDNNGEYLIHNLNPGSYTLQARMVGKAEQTVEGIQVSADLTTRIDFELGDTATGSTVITVTDQRGLIVFDETSSVNIISSDDIDAMPVTSIRDLIAMNSGGVSSGSDFHMRGGRSGEVIYMVDGIVMNDPATNLFTMEIPLSAVSEISITSGGFSAEYGGAQSGIVNIITRDATEKFMMSLNGGGGAFSENGDASLNTMEHSVWENQIYHGDAVKGEGAIGGPTFLPGESGFFVSGSYNRSGFNHADSRGYWDNSTIETLSGTAKLSWKPTPMTRIVANLYISDGEKGWRDWLWSRTVEHYVNDGDTLYYSRENDRALPVREQNRFSPGIAITHSFNERSFIEFKLNLYHTEETHGITDSTGSIIGEDFSIDEWLEYEAPYQFEDRDHFYRSGHTDWIRHESESDVVTVRTDYTSQLNAYHQLKTGYEGRFFNSEGWDIYSPPNYTVTYSSWEGAPRFSGIYAQDRIEYTAGLIANIGARIDIIDPNDENSDVKYKFSPRLGVSHPVSDRDMFRASYGHYYQVPGLSMMYYESQSSSSSSGEPLSGNPNLDPEETVAYELGLKHIFDPFTLVEMVAYNKTITGLVSTDLQESTEEFWQYVNSDGTGTVWGVELGLIRRSSRFFSFAANYSYSVAKGRESSPAENYSYGWGTQFPIPRDDVYLDWDQRHTANASAGLMVERGDAFFGQRWLEGFGFRINSSFGSGIPYDNASHGTHPFFRNQERYPWRMNTDLRVEKRFWSGDLTFNIYMDVYNLFNRTNLDHIYNVAWYDADQDGDGEPDHIAGGPAGNPNAYSPQRHFFFGADIRW